MVKTLAPQNLCKQAYTKSQFTMDFSGLMATGETIDSIVSVNSELRGGGASDLLLTSEEISGQTVTLWIESGTKNNTYRIEIRILSSGLQKLEGDGLLKITN